LGQVEGGVEPAAKVFLALHQGLEEWMNRWLKGVDACPTEGGDHLLNVARS